MDFIKKELQIDSNNVDDFNLYAVKVELNDIGDQLSPGIEIDDINSNQQIALAYKGSTRNFLLCFHTIIKLYLQNKRENVCTHDLHYPMSLYNSWHRLSVRLMQELNIPIEDKFPIAPKPSHVTPTDVNASVRCAMKSTSYFYKLIRSKNHPDANVLKLVSDNLCSELQGLKLRCGNIFVCDEDVNEPSNLVESPSNPMSTMITEHFPVFFGKLFVQPGN